VARVFPPTKHIERSASDEVIAGRVAVDMLVQPNKAGPLTIPALSMWTFDPDRARDPAAGSGASGWVELRTQPLTLQVRAKGAAASATTGGDASAGRQLIARGARPLKANVRAEPRAGDAPVVVGGSVLGVGALAFVVGEARRRKRGSASGKALAEHRARRARLEEALTRGDLAAVERALLDALAARFTAAVRSKNTAELAPFLVERGLDVVRADEIVALIRDLEAARYAPGATAERKRLLEQVRATVGTLDTEAGPRPAVRRAVDGGAA
jgi:hypothetical protein